VFYKVYLDDILIDEPVGLDGLSDTLRRDRSIKGILHTQDVSLSFILSGYQYLKSKYDVSYDSQARCKIYESENGDAYLELYSGIVFCSEVEWNERDYIAKVKVQDNSFYARINNNKSIKIFPQGGKSKNGVVIDVPEAFKINRGIFNPYNCGEILNEVNATITIWFYKVSDVLKYMIRWMSDDELQFSCPDLEAGWIGGKSEEVQYVTLTTGRVLRKSYVDSFNDTDADFKASFPGLDFNTLLTNVCKIADFSFYIDYSTAKPTFRLERESVIRDTNVTAILEDIENIKTKIEVSQLPAKIAMGSSTVTNGDTGWAAFPERAPMIGWNQEEFVIKTKSNIDTVLDLKLDFVTSSNMIQDAFENIGPSLTDDSIDKDLFFLMVYNSSGNWVATQTDWVSSVNSFCLFNELLTNSFIIQRFFGGIPSSIANDLDSTPHFSRYRR
jgi:hypothetical protein